MDETHEPASVELIDRRVRFDVLYAACQAAVLGYVLRRSDDPEDAADAIAETFLIAWRRLDEVPYGDERRLWLYGVARRVLANQRRGEKRRFALTQRLSTELARVPLAVELTGMASEPADALHALADAFKRLSEPDREILALQGWEGLEPVQIAAVLGCSRNAARIRLHRARRRLAEQLARQEVASKTSESRALLGEAT
jgi:RNA polymerase sigma-70 factor (ECF subfamily)